MVNRVGITGILRVSGGLLFILSFGLEVIGFRQGQLGNFPVDAFLAALMVAAVTLLGIGLWRLRAWKPPLSRAGRVGLYLSLVALAGFGVTAAALVVSAVQTDISLFFALGLLLSVIGPILLGAGLLSQGIWLITDRPSPAAPLSSTVGRHTTPSYRGCIFGVVSMVLAICLMVSTVNYLRYDPFSCYGQLGAGFPVAFICDYSGGGSPLSSAGKIDSADFPFLSLPGSIVDISFYHVLLWIAWLMALGISHLVRRRVQSK